MKAVFSKLKDKIMPGIMAASVALAVPTSAMAVTIKDNLDATVVVGNVLEYLLLAGQLVGGGVLIYALISFGLSIAQQNPDQQANAIKYIVAGAILVSIRFVLKFVGVIA